MFITTLAPLSAFLSALFQSVLPPSFECAPDVSTLMLRDALSDCCKLGFPPDPRALHDAIA